ncbi:ciliogenesis and planar polarity effector 2 [Varanus komodoensis]|uniref:Ciliogenesis and planar polarity effector 2 n=1 Tax=Varanus komodoensis TaxID=61221 RepID=A0A8D2JIJ7_VARKO|nr:ciliogenesis and planar polarity effector 2 [Varanus komodoensis]XP_044277143.1 ciliogenesis and planar polarity effector 2 [Varanus komodoensis]XP_044277144.1 ciliogenesis and planar polarity effector 2 [Varanus komodoensis]
MIVPAGSVLVPDWHKTQEGKGYFGTLLQRNRRKSFGLIERPVLPPQEATDIASYKIFVSGKSGVGKTALVARLAGLEMPWVHHETTGIQTTIVYWPAKLRESGRALFFKFSFWDCGEAVLKKFDHILPACTERVDGFLFLFSFTDRASFEDLPNQICRIADGAKNAVKIVIGTKFDQFAHTDVTEHNVATFRHAWRLPVLRAKSINTPRMGDGQSLDGYARLSDVAHLLNGLAEHLWRQDQAVAGLIPLPETPEVLEEPSHC